MTYICSSPWAWLYSKQPKVSALTTVHLVRHVSTVVVAIAHEWFRQAVAIFALEGAWVTLLQHFWWVDWAYKHTENAKPDYILKHTAGFSSSFEASVLNQPNSHKIVPISHKLGNRARRLRSWEKQLTITGFKYNIIKSQSVVGLLEELCHHDNLQKKRTETMTKGMSCLTQKSYPGMILCNFPLWDASLYLKIKLP